MGEVPLQFSARRIATMLLAPTVLPACPTAYTINLTFKVQFTTGNKERGGGTGKGGGERETD